ncbi:hypothetical protein V9L05_18855 [Bernardetia sp. Wsw4-3y2]|uniref:hypothetical protein n=1 Tax=Bernardetia sp. Wsw4-3y2 TaxID=3127471 RepID=UPI0030D43BE8
MQNKFKQNTDALQQNSTVKESFLDNIPEFQNPDLMEMKDKVEKLSGDMIDTLDRFSLKNSFMLAFFEYARHCTGDIHYQKNIDNLQIIFHTL